MKHGRMSGAGGNNNGHAIRHSAGHAAVIRYLVFGVLLVVGGCTIATAGLLMTRAIEKPSDALLWVGKQQATPAAKVQPAEEQLELTKPMTKELDPDYIEPKAQQAVVYAGRECPAGCEKQGNCNAEEGR